MSLFEEIFGPFGLSNAFQPNALQPMSEEELKAQREMEADAIRQYDPARAELLRNLQTLAQIAIVLTPEERQQINAIAAGAIGRQHPYEQLARDFNLPPQEF